MSISKLLITILLVVVLIGGGAVGAVKFFGVDVPVVSSLLGAKDDGTQDVGFEDPIPANTTDPTLEIQPYEEEESAVTETPKETEKIVGYSEFIGDGYVISVPKNWETEMSIDKRSFVATSEVADASISVQVGGTGKTLDEFAKSATELLWKSGNLALCLNTEVGEFPAKEIEFLSGDRLTTGKELVIVDDALALAYIVTVQCPVEDEGRYELVLNDALTSFKLIEVTSEAPAVKPGAGSLEVGQLFEDEPVDKPVEGESKESNDGVSASEEESVDEAQDATNEKVTEKTE